MLALNQPCIAQAKNSEGTLLAAHVVFSRYTDSVVLLSPRANSMRVKIRE